MLNITIKVRMNFMCVTSAPIKQSRKQMWKNILILYMKRYAFSVKLARKNMYQKANWTHTSNYFTWVKHSNAKSVMRHSTIAIICIYMSKKFINALNTFARFAKKNSMTIKLWKDIFSIFTKESDLIVMSAVNNFKPMQIFKGINWKFIKYENGSLEARRNISMWYMLIKAYGLEKFTCGNCWVQRMWQKVWSPQYISILPKKMVNFWQYFYADSIRGLQKYGFLSYLKDRTCNPAHPAVTLRLVLPPILVKKG